MDIEDELFLEDDRDILEIIDFGFPRRNYLREEYFDLMDNHTFFKRFRLTKQTTVQILEQIEEHLEFDNDLNNSVSPINQLLASLRFYACGTHQDAIGDFMGMHQTTASRIIKKVSEMIALLKPAYISMPIGNEIIQVQNDFYQLARFPGVVGCVDGTHIKIKSPGGEDAEIYRNRKGYFSLNAQVICDSKLKIRDIVVRWPGSVHDFTVFNHSRIRAQLEAGEFPNSVLLADSGYADRPYLMTPLGNPNNRAEQLYNESQIRTRNSIERQIGVWKMRFLSLLYGLRCKLQTCLSVVVATAILHNIARDMNEDMPPALENINEEQLRYLVEMGNIPHIPLNENDRIPMNNHRRNIINQYFGYL